MRDRPDRSLDVTFVRVPVIPCPSGRGEARERSAPGPQTCGFDHLDSDDSTMNISKREQRVLHALAQGGLIRHLKDDTRAIIAADCITRDGWALTDCTLELFQRLRRRGFIASSGGGPYRITRLGLEAVRAQLDNR